MPVVVILAVLVVIGIVVVWRGGTRGTDLPTRIVVSATNRLPASRRDWGQAMLAEVAQVPTRGARWRFALGVLWVALFPPTRNQARVAAVAIGGLVLAAGATIVAVEEMPSLAVFVGVLTVLLCGYLTVLSARSPRPQWTVPGVLVGAVAVAGIGGTIATMVWTALAHPTAVADPTHVYSVAFAVLLIAYLAFALASPSLGGDLGRMRWWAIAGALASGTVWTVAAFAAPADAGSVVRLISPVGAATVLAVSVAAAAASRHQRTGFRAGLLAGMLGIPILFATDMASLLRTPSFTLTDPYDIAKFPHSGFPDVASFVISDAIGGHIIGGMVLYPVALVLLALIGSMVGGAVRPATGGARLAVPGE
jgi:hypothetical protein